MMSASVATLQNQLAQNPLGDNPISWILNLLFYVVFIVFLFYGQRIQLYVEGS
jgi:hypothetical protein